MKYNDACKFLENTAKIKHTLEELAEFLKKIGSPHEKLRVIHVAGTNGKGGTCAMLTEILMQSGYRVGTFTSPHLSDYTERIRVNGLEMPRVDFANHFEVVHKFCPGLSFFETLTFMAFLYFSRAELDFVIIETGIGGRLDATNVVANPILSVITSIDIDHTDILGETLEEIAKEKAGIIRQNSPVVLYFNNEMVYNVVKEIADEKGTVLYFDKASPNITKRTLDGAVFDVTSEYFSYESLRLNLFGDYQVRNACGVLLCVSVLRSQNLEIPPEAVIRAFAAVTHRGRAEILEQSLQLPILVDGAHNPAGAAAFSETLDFFVNYDIILITSIMRDKDVAGILTRLAEKADTVILTNMATRRAAPPRDLIKYVCDKMYTIEDNPHAAFETALSLVRHRKTLIAIGGSLCLAGDMRNYILNR
ncbi:bifunctional folylpolyglutamate synthase/dihydrofolate synthase [Clostridia bacterium]|nr:bifunctional folylpolyglutamate synthase/dihydrofolate synthase [Clostridia bacterium]